MSGLQFSSVGELEPRVLQKSQETSSSQCINEEKGGCSEGLGDREERSGEPFSARLEAALSAIRLDQPVAAGGNPLPLPPLETQSLSGSTRLITAANAETTTEEALYALALAQGLDPQVVAGVLWPGQPVPSGATTAVSGGVGGDLSGLVGRELRQGFAMAPSWAVSPMGEANPVPANLTLAPGIAALAGLEGVSAVPGAALTDSAGGVTPSPGASLLGAALAGTSAAAGSLTALGSVSPATAGATPSQAAPSRTGLPAGGPQTGLQVDSAILASLARDPRAGEAKANPPPGLPTSGESQQSGTTTDALLARTHSIDAALPQSDKSARALPANSTGWVSPTMLAPLGRNVASPSDSKRDWTAPSFVNTEGPGTDGSEGPTDAVLALRAATPKGMVAALQASAPSAAEWMGRQYRGDPLGLVAPSVSTQAVTLAAHPFNTPVRRLADEATSSGTELGVAAGSPQQDSIDLSDLQQGPQQVARSEADRELARHRLSEALSNRILAQVSRGEWDLQLDLKPADLGHVKIELSLHHGRLEAVFDAPNPAARALIVEGLDRLRLDLEKAGMNVAHLGMQQFGGGAGGGKPTPGRFERRADSGSGDPARGQRADESSATAQSTSDRILDIRV